MDRPTSKERDETLAIIFAENPALTATEALTFVEAVYSLAIKLHGLYTAQCNRLLTTTEHARIRTIEAQLKATFEGVGLGLYLNGDPRGNPVGILTPKTGRYNTMGGASDGWRL